MPAPTPARIAAALALVTVPAIALAGCSFGGTETVTSTTTVTSTATTTAAAPTTAATTTTAAPVPARCANGNLTVVQGQGQAGAGAQEAVFVLTNSGSATCTLGGYPGMGFYAANGTELAGSVKRGGTTLFTDPGPSPLTLSPNGSVSYSLGFTDAQNDGCEDTGYVTVTPPNATQSIKVTTSGQNAITVCEGQPLTVSALVQGDGGAPQ